MSKNTMPYPGIRDAETMATHLNHIANALLQDKQIIASLEKRLHGEGYPSGAEARAVHLEAEREHAAQLAAIYQASHMVHQIAYDRADLLALKRNRQNFPGFIRRFIAGCAAVWRVVY